MTSTTFPVRPGCTTCTEAGFCTDCYLSAPDPKEAPMTTDPRGRTLCAHGYVLCQDSCPGCDSGGETPHAADLVPVPAGQARRSRAVRRCQTCGLEKAAYVHRRKR